MIETPLLYLFSAAALGGALTMLVARHPMRVALALIATMLSLAGIYALLGVHVIAVFQVLIYVGAVMVFIVYVIMLLDVRDRSYVQRYSRLVVPAIVGFAALVGALAYGLFRDVPPPVVAAPGGRFGVTPFSVDFLHAYWLHFELVSVLLVAAIVAALAVIRIAFRRRG
jgi:NADH-quinone oxidoreductase subunit J